MYSNYTGGYQSPYPPQNSPYNQPPHYSNYPAQPPHYPVQPPHYPTQPPQYPAQPPHYPAYSNQPPHYPEYPPHPRYDQPHYNEGPGFTTGPPPPPSTYVGNDYTQGPQYRPPPSYNNRYPIRPPSTFQYADKIPDIKHMHPLFKSTANRDCHICRQFIGGGQAYVCRDCELVLCLNCFYTIYHGNKFENIHMHPLVLRVRPSWKCDVCQRTFSGRASFYCQPCDFDACSECYIGY